MPRRLNYLRAVPTTNRDEPDLQSPLATPKFLIPAPPPAVVELFGEWNPLGAHICETCLRTAGQELKIGVPNTTTTSKRKPHCLLELSVLEKPRLPKKIADLYGSGHSIHEIAKMLHKSRGGIRGHLERAGILLPVTRNSPSPATRVHRGKVRWNSPYGFKYEQGRATPHPQEFETLRMILELGHSGRNAREIADLLNAQKLRPRTAKRWDRCTVHRILEWHRKQPNFLQEVQSWNSNNSSK